MCIELGQSFELSNIRTLPVILWSLMDTDLRFLQGGLMGNKVLNLGSGGFRFYFYFDLKLDWQKESFHVTVTITPFLQCLPCARYCAL